MDQIKIALPSKGRLRRDMETLFKAKQISFANLSNDRDYIGSVEGHENILVYFLSFLWSRFSIRNYFRRF